MIVYMRALFRSVGGVYRGYKRRRSSAEVIWGNGGEVKMGRLRSKCEVECKIRDNKQ